MVETVSRRGPHRSILEFSASEVLLVARGQPSYYLNGMADPQRSWHSHNDPADEWKLAMKSGCSLFARSI
jgi:hypothetical protein